MKILEIESVAVEGHRFRTLLSRPAVCAEAVASIAEAIQETREQMHPQVSSSTKGMHTYAHLMTNLGYAMERHGGRLEVVKGQQRIVFDQTDGLGVLHVTVTKGTPASGGFEVGEKGTATEQLIGIPQQAFDLDLPAIPMDDGAFLVHAIIPHPHDPEVLDVVVYLAHPARLNDKKTFLACDECVLLGRRSIRISQPTLPNVGAPTVVVTPRVRTARA
ncbi:hypothetical protein EON81_23010 [bacterium]|nr:MAG: hypothetical protein EON81_23010 [bacterium]